MEISELLDIKQRESVEEKNADDTGKLGWEYSDVLFSFLGIYVLGLYAFDKDNDEKKFRRTKCGLIKLKAGNVRLYCRKQIKELYKEEFAKDLNNLDELKKFMSLYYSIGNLIPIWPGGNVHKGFSDCYDLAHIYFSNEEERFKSLKKQYPNAYLDEIMNPSFKKDVNLFLDDLTRNRYIEFLEHVNTVIENRSNKLKIQL